MLVAESADATARLVAKILKDHDALARRRRRAAIGAVRVTPMLSDDAAERSRVGVRRFGPRAHIVVRGRMSAKGLTLSRL